METNEKRPPKKKYIYMHTCTVWDGPLYSKGTKHDWKIFTNEDKLIYFLSAVSHPAITSGETWG